MTEPELRMARDAEIADIGEQMVAPGWQRSRSELLGEGVIFSDDPGAYQRELTRQGSGGGDVENFSPMSSATAAADSTPYR